MGGNCGDDVNVNVTESAFYLLVCSGSICMMRLRFVLGITFLGAEFEPGTDEQSRSCNHLTLPSVRQWECACHRLG